MLVKYYLNDNIKVSFEDFALDLQNAWAGPAFDISLFLFFTKNKLKYTLKKKNVLEKIYIKKKSH